MTKTLTLGQIEAVKATLDAFYTLQIDQGVYIMEAGFVDSEGLPLGRATYNGNTGEYDWSVQ